MSPAGISVKAMPCCTPSTLNANVPPSRSHVIAMRCPARTSFSPACSSTQPEPQVLLYAATVCCNCVLRLYAATVCCDCMLRLYAVTVSWRDALAGAPPLLHSLLPVTLCCYCVGIGHHDGTCPGAIVLLYAATVCCDCMLRLYAVTLCSTVCTSIGHATCPGAIGALLAGVQHPASESSATVL
eukprot:480523-Rhodomonas_salina.2